MHQPSDGDVLIALGRGYDVEVVFEATRNGQRVDIPLVLESGSVTMSSGTGTRGVLNATFAPRPGLRDALIPSGLYLTPTWLIRWGATGIVRVPFGDFLVDSQDVSYDRDSGGVQVTAPDSWVRVARRRINPVAPSGRAVAIAAEWVRSAHGELKGELLSASTARVHGARYEYDRDEAIRGVLGAIGLQAFVDRYRRLVINERPDLTAPPLWEVTPIGRDGTFESAQATRSARDVVNSYTVHPDVPGRFAPFYVEDTDPRSPTRVTGPMGRLTALEPVVVPGAPTQAVARASVLAKLRRTTSLAFATSVTAAANPFIDPDDAGLLTLPAQGGEALSSEKALVDEVTHPLVPGDLMSLKLRSRNPSQDVE